MTSHAWRREALQVVRRLSTTFAAIRAAGEPCRFPRLIRVASWLVILSTAGSAPAALTFSFTPGPGLVALSGSDPAKAASIMAGVSTAASKWSGLIGESVTLKYAIDYDPALPALGAAFDVYMPVPYATVKPALISKASSAFDVTATASLQPGPTLALWINSLFVGPSFPPGIDADGSVNNDLIDISRAHQKGLGLLPPADGGPGADGTLKFGSAAFDFDPSDGIDPGKYDFVGVALHEMAHSMGFISGVDTLSTLLPPSPFSPPGPYHATAMVTVLDFFRYSSDSVAAGPLIPDVSLPVPGFSPTRYFSLDGGATPIELFSTGIGLAGDGEQAGHWKADATFGLMDPELAAGFTLTEEFEDTLGVPPPPDLVALDVVGWTIITAVPEASSFVFGAVICGATALGYKIRRRRRRRRKGVAPTLWRAGLSIE